MIIKASTTHDYELIPTYEELDLFLQLYAGKVKPSGNGWTFKSYDAIDSYLIKDMPVLEKPSVSPTVTRSYDTKTQVLHVLKRGLEVTTGAFLDVSKGLFLPSRSCHRTRLGMTANHIPQVYGLYPVSGSKSRVCTSVYGNYDLVTRVFTGQMEFTTLEALWSV